MLFVDGMRGLLAVIVVVYHITDSVHAAELEHIPAVLRLLISWVRSGAGDRVAMFSALSGFCLMLSVLADPDHAIRGGTLDFVRRRTRRILPAYYAALLLAVALVYRTYLDGRMAYDEFWEHCAPVKVVSHLLLIHNFWESHIAALIYPAWNLAVEWQLYFLFCLVLVPMWRRGGGLRRPWRSATALGGVAGAIGCLSLLLPASNGTMPSTLRTSFPWLAAPFVIGMLGAVAVRLPGADSAGAPGWARGALGTAVVLGGLHLAGDPPFGLRYALAGLLCTLLLGMCLTGARAPSATGPRRWVQNFLECRCLLWVGACSYSVYLTHALVLPRAHAALMRLLPVSLLPFVWLAELGLAVGFGYVFYLLVERPFARRGASS